MAESAIPKTRSNTSQTIRARIDKINAAADTIAGINPDTGARDQGHHCPGAAADAAHGHAANMTAQQRTHP
jgi:hypothetical protein